MNKYDQPRNCYPQAITRVGDNVHDSRVKLQQFDFWVRDVRSEGKKTLVSGEIIYIPKGVNQSSYSPDYLEKKTVLRIPFNEKAMLGYKNQIIKLDDSFAIESFATTQHIEPVETVLSQAAILVKSAHFHENYNMTAVRGIVLGLGPKNTVIGKMTEGREVYFSTFTPLDKVRVDMSPPVDPEKPHPPRVVFFDDLVVNFRTTDTECTFHGVDMRTREEVPFTPENLQARHKATYDAAMASQTVPKKKKKPGEQEEDNAAEVPPAQLAKPQDPAPF